LLSSNDVPSGRPYPQYQSIGGSTNNAVSNYNSLQMSITKRMTHGVGLSFTMSGRICWTIWIPRDGEPRWPAGFSNCE